MYIRWVTCFPGLPRTNANRLSSLLAKASRDGSYEGIHISHQSSKQSRHWEPRRKANQCALAWEVESFSLLSFHWKCTRLRCSGFPDISSNKSCCLVTLMLCHIDVIWQMLPCGMAQELLSFFKLFHHCFINYSRFGPRICWFGLAQRVRWPASTRMVLSWAPLAARLKVSVWAQGSLWSLRWVVMHGKTSSSPSGISSPTVSWVCIMLMLNFNMLGQARRSIFGKQFWYARFFYL